MMSYGTSLDQEVTNANIGIHHAKFGEVLKEKMDALGIPCVVNVSGGTLGGGERSQPIDFIKRHLKVAD